MLSESRERWFQLVHLYDATWIRAKHLTHRALSRFRRQRRRTRREGKGKVTYGDRSYESKWDPRQTSTDVEYVECTTHMCDQRISTFFSSLDRLQNFERQPRSEKGNSSSQLSIWDYRGNLQRAVGNQGKEEKRLEKVGSPNSLIECSGTADLDASCRRVICLRDTVSGSQPPFWEFLCRESKWCRSSCKILSFQRPRQLLICSSFWFMLSFNFAQHVHWEI